MGRPVPLPVKPEIEAACHPQRRHEQRIEEYEIEQESPRRDEGYSGEAPHHEQEDSESSETFDHLKGYQAVEMAGRIESLSGRTEERRVGKEGGSTCRSRGSPVH